ncbi:MAG: GxxExxY protein [Tepidisphaeraceae bacterium]
MLPVDAKDPLTYQIIGACMEVHRRLGGGFLEAVYQEALEREFSHRGLPFKRQVELLIFYRDEPLNCTYRADFICFDDIIVEIKAIKGLSSVERSQVIHYLRVTRHHKALLVNFGGSSLEFERIIF